MDVRFLRYFVAVAEELSFTRAAARLNMAQPPLSQQIRKLESQLGVNLFTRTKRRVEITEAGRLLLQQTQQALRAIEQGTVLAQRAGRGELGRLVLGFVEYMSYTVIPPILRAFRERFPEVDLVLRVFTNMQQLIALRSGQIDVSFLRPPADGRDIRSQLLSHEHFVLAMPATHRLAHEAAVSIKQLANDMFIMYPRELGPTFHHEIFRFCERAGFSPKVALEVNRIHTAVGLVSSGIGVALVPGAVKRLHLDNVVYRPFRERAPTIDVLMAWHKERFSPLLQAFLDVAVELSGGEVAQAEKFGARRANSKAQART
jgi:DNA-binding transcriptional LysR family regulator